MIKTECILKIDPNQYDEVWWIVRSPQTEPKREKLVKELSPSTELFKEYRIAFHSGQFDSNYFQKIYVPKFIKQLSNNYNAIEIIEKLYMESYFKDIVLGCYCDNEALCHRSIIAGILLGMGAKIETNPKYLEYFELYKRIH